MNPSTAMWWQRRPMMRSALTAAALVLALTACGDKKADKPASQTAAKVNKQEITVHQINYVLQQQRGLRPEQADAASREILQRLVDQELAVQKSEEMKLDRDPRVVQQIEAARREIVSRAYVDRLGEAAAKPSADDIQKYYDAKPALFKERRIYNIQEVAIEAKPDQVPALREKLAAAKTFNEFVEYLKASDIRFSGNQAVRAAEQLPLASLDSFAKMRDGQALLNPTPTGAQVVVLAGSRSQPVALEQARPAIEQFLLNERKRELVAKDIKAMREAAKIEYVGKFAENAPGAAAAPGSTIASSATATPAPTPAPATPAPAAAGSAANGLDASSISKGLGIK